MLGALTFSAVHPLTSRLSWPIRHWQRWLMLRDLLIVVLRLLKQAWKLQQNVQWQTSIININGQDPGSRRLCLPKCPSRGKPWNGWRSSTWFHVSDAKTQWTTMACQSLNSIQVEKLSEQQCTNGRGGTDRNLHRPGLIASMMGVLTVKPDSL